tara:strand:+ start:115 stop:375 length:261 start_codon:yes stop_codon:yes gene_type:complete
MAAVDAALIRIDPDCYVGLYAETIRKELERALYDQLFDEQNTLRYLWTKYPKNQICSSLIVLLGARGALSAKRAVPLGWGYGYGRL